MNNRSISQWDVAAVRARISICAVSLVALVIVCLPAVPA